MNTELENNEAVDADIERLEQQCIEYQQEVNICKKKYEKAKQNLEETRGLLDKLKSQRDITQNKKSIAKTSENLKAVWIDAEFPWNNNVREALQNKFKLSEFRPKQLAAINATMAERDVILLMPTGGGKSLVYQLPAVISDGFTLVIAPLISLIGDQLIAMKNLEIHAATIHSGTTRKDTEAIYKLMVDKTSTLKLLYVTPEWIAKSKRFMGVLKKSYDARRITRVAIDEVHCCSTWGHDFRPDYEHLGILRQELDKVPFLGLTATATTSVLTDVKTMLNLKRCLIITAPFNRKNLYYKVIPKSSKNTETLDYLENLLKKDYCNKSGIIYTTTISDSNNLAQDLKTRGLKVAPYHAQLDQDKKEHIHNKWLQNRYQAVVATVAFGMGIDKPDVRFVIHHAVPRSMENLYQESGRAGRDGTPADCIVLFSLQDSLKILGSASSTREENKALDVLSYCLDQTSCRRELIAKHFDERWDKKDCNQMCDHCRNLNVEIHHYDIKNACDTFHSIIVKAKSDGENLTLIKLMDAYFKTGPKKFRLENLPTPRISREKAEILVGQLLIQKYLSILRGYNTYSTISYIQIGKNSAEGKSIEFTTRDRYPGFKTISNENNTGEHCNKRARTE